MFLVVSADFTAVAEQDTATGRDRHRFGRNICTQFVIRLHSSAPSTISSLSTIVMQHKKSTKCYLVLHNLCK
jgi:hypothetical protein